MLRVAVAGGIRGYQLYLSPYKGFCCAYRAKCRRWSCSEYARRLVLRSGAGALVRGLPRQFARCRAVSLALSEASSADEKNTPEPKKRTWRDRCDCALRGCEAPTFCI
jgi:putative component of membrane protein insertase Oxa1/YidC/SpoIIIJ protein YidD